MNSTRILNYCLDRMKASHGFFTPSMKLVKVFLLFKYGKIHIYHFVFRGSCASQMIIDFNPY